MITVNNVVFHIDLIYSCRCTVTYVPPLERTLTNQIFHVSVCPPVGNFQHV